MPKRYRRFQHHGVVPTPVDLQIRPAGQRRAHPNDYLPRPRLRYCHTLQPKVFLAVKHRRRHLSYHSFYLLISCPFDALSAFRNPSIDIQSTASGPASDNLSHITRCPLSLQRSSPSKSLPPSRTTPSCPGARSQTFFPVPAIGRISTARWTRSASVPCRSLSSPASSRAACSPCSRRPRSRP